MKNTSEQRKRKSFKYRVDVIFVAQHDLEAQTIGMALNRAITEHIMKHTKVASINPRFIEGVPDEH